MGILVVDVSPSHSNTLGKAAQHPCHCTLPRLQPGSRIPTERTLEFRGRTAASGTPTNVNTNPAKARVKYDVNVVEGMRGADVIVAVEVVVVEGENTLLQQAADAHRQFEPPVTA